MNHHYISYTIGIEEDDLHRGKFMVVIRDDTGHVKGIPARNLTKNEAESQLPSLTFAFNYGVEAQRSVSRYLTLDLRNRASFTQDVQKARRSKSSS